MQDRTPEQDENGVAANEHAADTSAAACRRPSNTPRDTCTRTARTLSRQPSDTDAAALASESETLLTQIAGLSDRETLDVLLQHIGQRPSGSERSAPLVHADYLAACCGVRDRHFCAGIAPVLRQEAAGERVPMRPEVQQQ